MINRGKHWKYHDAFTVLFGSDVNLTVIQDFGPEFMFLSTLYISLPVYNNFLLA